MLGPDIDARPTYQQVTQLTYITQILKEALRLWPPAPAYGIAPLKDETIGGKYKLKKNTFITVLVMALHRDPSVWGPNPDSVRSREFQPRGRGQAAGQRLEAVRQRPARLHRPRLCDARGGAGDRHDPAALQADRHPSLSDASERDADDQARRLQDQGAAAHRQGARRVRRSCRGGSRCVERGGAARRGRARATTRRCWCSTAPTSAPRRNWRRASPTSPRSTALPPRWRRSTTMSASCRSRAAC